MEQWIFGDLFTVTSVNILNSEYTKEKRRNYGLHSGDYELYGHLQGNAL
jgi:hypothetical protein